MAQKLLSGSVFNLGSLIFTSTLLVASIPVLVHGLGSKTYGVWVVITAVFSVASSANLALGTPATKFFGEAHARDDSQDASRILTLGMALASGIGGVGAIALLLSTGEIANLLHLSGALRNMTITSLRIISIGIVPILATQVLLGVLASDFRYGRLNIVQGGSTAVLTLGLTVMVLTGRSIVSLSVWTVSVAWGTLAISAIFARPLLTDMRPSFDWRSNETSRIVRYSGYAWLSGLGSLVFSQADRLLVGFYLGPVAAGRYAICIGLATKLTQLSTALSQVLVPGSSSLQAKHGDEIVIRLVRKSSRLIAYVIFATAAAVFIWAHVALRLWLGDAFADSNTTLLRVSIVAYAVFSISAPSYWVLYGLGRSRVVALVGLAGALAMVGLIVRFVPSSGLVWAGVANFGYAINLLLPVAALRALNAPLGNEFERTFLLPVVAFAGVLVLALLVPGTPAGSLVTSVTAFGVFGFCFLRTDAPARKRVALVPQDA